MLLSFLDTLASHIPPNFYGHLDTLRPYTWHAVGLLTASYLSAVQLLRWRNFNKLHKEYEGKIHLNHRSLAGDKRNGHAKTNGTTGSGVANGTQKHKYGKSMSPTTAQKIICVAGEYDMPGIMEISLSIALFKTYAIPSISKLLQSTKQLSVKDHGSKRYSDTGVLISTWLHCPVVEGENMTEEEKAKADPRAAIAIARVNWLHSKYKINNDDYIYTMSLFVLEPIKWAKKYGWRELSPLEQEAFYVLWYDVGVKMGIKDIPESLDELLEWSENFEKAYMVPAESNKALAEYTFTYFGRASSERFGVRKFMRSLITCFLDERVRIAMMQPEQPAYMHRIVNLIVAWYRFKFRYLALPRFKPKMYSDRDVKEEKLQGPCPRAVPNKFSKEPWYKPEPKGFALLMQNIRVRLGLLDPEFLPGPKYKSQGFRLEECGPMADENWHAEVMKMAEEMQGCPVVGPWARRT